MGCFLKRVSLGILFILIAKTFAQGATNRLVHPGFFMGTASPARELFLVPSAALQTPAPGPVTYAYEELGRLIAVFDANGNAAVYNYDAVGNILSITRYASTQASAFSFSPTHGAPGTQVTIYGTGFSTTPGQNTVLFNGASATVAAAAANQLVVTVPNAATTGPISVTSPAGSVTSTSNFTITAATAAPIIDSFSANIAAVGAPLTINGANFDPVVANNRLRINNVSWSAVTASTNTTLSTTIPTLTGSGRVALYTPAGDVVSQGDLFIPFGTLTTPDIGYTARMTIGASQVVTLAPNKSALILFDAVAGQKISVQVTNSTFVSSSVHVILPNSTVWTSGTPSIPSIALPVTGTYTLGIVGGSAGGSATVQLGTDVLGTIAIDGPAVTAATTIPGQDVRLVFNAPVHAGQQIVLWATNVTNPTATISLVGPTGEPQPLLPSNAFFINNNPPGQQFFLDQQTLLANGTYTVLVQHSGTNVGSETLRIASAPDFVVPIVPGGPAVRIPAAGDTIIGENGRLTFSGLPGQKASISISGGTYPPAANSCLVSLKSPTSAIVSQGWNCGLGANTFVDSTTLNESGRYTVLVDPQGQSTGHTNVQVYTFSDATGTVSIDGPAVTATTTVPGQDARYTFSAMAGQRVVLRITNVTNPSASVHILKPDGTTQVDMGGINNNPAGQTFFLDTQTLAAAGNYTVFVQHIGTKRRQ